MNSIDFDHKSPIWIDIAGRYISGGPEISLSDELLPIKINLIIDILLMNKTLKNQKRRP